MDSSRAQAETFLKMTAKDGAYLFRPSTKHHCALSVFFENEVRHFGIQLTKENKLQFESIGLDVEFSSLEEIVNHFKTYPVLKTANTRQIIKLSGHVKAK